MFLILPQAGETADALSGFRQNRFLTHRPFAVKTLGPFRHLRVVRFAAAKFAKTHVLRRIEQEHENTRKGKMARHGTCGRVGPGQVTLPGVIDAQRPRTVVAEP